MKRFWLSNLVTLVYQKSTTSSCIDNFRFCLSIYKNGRIIRFQWMNQTTKRKAPSGRALLTRTTREDKHRKYRPISEMLEECVKTKPIVLWRVKISWSISHKLSNSHHGCSKKVLLPVLIIWQKHTDYNYPTKLRLKDKFFWSDKNGVVGSKKCL